jgi:preprotein translocase subunit YajC
MRKYFPTILILAILIALVGCGFPPKPGVDGAAPELTKDQFLMSTIWYIAAILFVLYVFIFSPAQKKDIAQQKFMEELKRNDQVVTSGGIFGRVVDKEKDFITVEIALNVRIKIKPDHLTAVEAKPKDADKKIVTKS